MSKTPHKTLIGAFVIGALALLLVAIAVFGSGKLFQSSIRFVLFFDSSVNGLTVGSPVMFRGVPVGRVTEIRLTGDMKNMTFQTPVFIELDQKADSSLGGDEGSFQTRDYLNQLVAHGLRANLAMQSLLTGQLMVEMNFYPRSELPSYIDKVNEYDDTLEIPTIPSKLDNAMQKAMTLPVEQIAANILEITAEINTFLKKADLGLILQHVDEMLVQLNRIGVSVDNTLVSVQALSQPYTQLAKNMDTKLSTTLDQATQTLGQVSSMTKEAEQTIASARGVMGRNSTTVLELNKALQEISDAARALRVLANTLERSPESLLRGKR